MCSAPLSSAGRDEALRAGNGCGVVPCETCGAFGTVATRVCSPSLLPPAALPGLFSTPGAGSAQPSLVFLPTRQSRAIRPRLGCGLRQPGGAGEAFYIGMARCRACNGCGLVPCMLCAGWEDPMLPPDPEHGPVPPAGAYFGGTDTLAWLERFPEPQAARRGQPAAHRTEQAAAGGARGAAPGEAPAGPEEWLKRFLDVKARLRQRRAEGGAHGGEAEQVRAQRPRGRPRKQPRPPAD